jgi:hypothetical protein
LELGRVDVREGCKQAEREDGEKRGMPREYMMHITEAQVTKYFNWSV